MTKNLCLPSRTFSRMQQDINSSFELQINYGANILFKPNTFTNISQRTQSKLAIVIMNSLDVYFTHDSVNNFHQEDRSLLDIWIKYGKNLIFENNAIRNVDIWRSSIMRIGFQHSYGTLQMATNAFVNINEGKLPRVKNSSNIFSACWIEFVELLIRMPLLLFSDQFLYEKISEILLQ